MYGPVMVGERVRLEPPRIESAATYIRWFADRDVTRYMMMRHPTSLKKEEEWLEHMAASADDVLWGIARAAGGELIGNVHLMKIAWRHRHAELSYVIGERDQWGKGHATEAVKLATAYAFLELGLEKVWAAVVDGNEASRRALERNGYRRSALFRRDRYVEGRWHDLWIGEILRDEWDSAQEATA
ncbi:MAG TPA: GNAT family N-acetyltransferase [Candidatus Methylomirabilis sp.]|nr:GNAT family N-acetyltransferase [Candidatus Methylomirabilis sp.]